MPLWECKYLWWSWKENKDLCVRNCFILPKPLECNSCHTMLKTNKIGEIYSEMPSYKYKSLSRKLYTHNLPNYIKQFQVICWWQNKLRQKTYFRCRSSHYNCCSSYVAQHWRRSRLIQMICFKELKLSSLPCNSIQCGVT